MSARISPLPMRKQELSALVDRACSVSSRGYMLGYHDLKDPSVSGFFRFLGAGRRRHDEHADRSGSDFAEGENEAMKYMRDAHGDVGAVCRVVPAGS